MGRRTRVNLCGAVFCFGNAYASAAGAFNRPVGVGAIEAPFLGPRLDSAARLTTPAGDGLPAGMGGMTAPDMMMPGGGMMGMAGGGGEYGLMSAQAMASGYAQMGWGMGIGTGVSGLGQGVGQAVSGIAQAYGMSSAAEAQAGAQRDAARMQAEAMGDAAKQQRMAIEHQANKAQEVASAEIDARKLMANSLLLHEEEKYKAAHQHQKDRDQFQASQAKEAAILGHRHHLKCVREQARLQAEAAKTAHALDLEKAADEERRLADRMQQAQEAKKQADENEIILQRQLEKIKAENHAERLRLEREDLQERAKIGLSEAETEQNRHQLAVLEMNLRAAQKDLTHIKRLRDEPLPDVERPEDDLDRFDEQFNHYYVHAFSRFKVHKQSASTLCDNEMDLVAVAASLGLEHQLDEIQPEKKTAKAKTSCAKLHDVVAEYQFELFAFYRLAHCVKRVREDLESSTFQMWREYVVRECETNGQIFELAKTAVGERVAEAAQKEKKDAATAKFKNLADALRGELQAWKDQQHRAESHVREELERSFAEISLLMYLEHHDHDAEKAAELLRKDVQALQKIGQCVIYLRDRMNAEEDMKKAAEELGFTDATSKIRCVAIANGEAANFSEESFRKLFEDGFMIHISKIINEGRLADLVESIATLAEQFARELPERLKEGDMGTEYIRAEIEQLKSRDNLSGKLIDSDFNGEAVLAELRAEMSSFQKKAECLKDIDQQVRKALQQQDETIDSILAQFRMLGGNAYRDKTQIVVVSDAGETRDDTVGQTLIKAGYWNFAVAKRKCEEHEHNGRAVFSNYFSTLIFGFGTLQQMKYKDMTDSYARNKYPPPAWLVPYIEHTKSDGIFNVNIALVGVRGVGKSTVNNALRYLGVKGQAPGLSKGEQIEMSDCDRVRNGFVTLSEANYRRGSLDYASTDAIQCTLFDRGYDFPLERVGFGKEVIPGVEVDKVQVTLWDIPGVDNDHPFGTYFASHGLRHFDAIAHVVESGWMEYDQKMLEHVTVGQLVDGLPAVPTIVIRNKIDMSAVSLYKQLGNKAPIQDTFDRAREFLEEKLSEVRGLQEVGAHAKVTLFVTDGLSEQERVAAANIRGARHFKFHVDEKRRRENITDYESCVIFDDEETRPQKHAAVEFLKLRTTLAEIVRDKVAEHSSKRLRFFEARQVVAQNLEALKGETHQGDSQEGGTQEGHAPDYISTEQDLQAEPERRRGE